jgi:hypothetical protein
MLYSLDADIIIKQATKKLKIYLLDIMCEMWWVGFNWLRISRTVGTCNHDEETSDFRKGGRGISWPGKQLADS